MNTKENPDYIQVNKATWNQKTEIHLNSDFYDVAGFLKGKSSLNDIELRLLGDVTGKRILHLQCHFGQDTISLARMGAITVGVDLSDKAIETANNLAQQTNTNATFICCDIYDLPIHLSDKFDIVFTSYGTIGWIPDLNKWAKVITHFLKPGGQLVFVEFHPVVWMFDDDFNHIKYRYFKSDPIIETENGTYADRTANITPQSITWNHGLGEVFTALLTNGLQITSFNEFDYSPYNCFNQTIEYKKGKYRIAPLEDKIPMVYAVTATKQIKV